MDRPTPAVPRQSGKALRTDGRWIVDRQGRVVLLRGVNAGGLAKLPPFLGLSAPEAAAQLASWGINAVRLPTVWEAIEPQPGRIDHAYLDRLAESAAWLTGRGLYVWIDLHQDLFARCFCGDGAPDWAVQVEPRLRDRALLPKPNGGPEWLWNYTSEPVTAAFARFWTDDDLQRHYLSVLSAVAARFAGEERVIGYEPFNEPWQGRFDVGSGEFERKVLAPFYERAAEAVRQFDPDAMIFIEPAVLAAGLFTMQSRLPLVEGGNMVYVPHFYPVGAITGSEPHVPTAVRAVERALDLVQEKAADLGMPAVLGEFGCHPRQKDGVEFIHGCYEALDARLMGGTIWNYERGDTAWNGEGMSLVEEDGRERPMVEAVVRPYPMAIAGTPTHLEFDFATRVLQLVVEGPEVDAPTELRVPRRVYPRGAVTRVSSGVAVAEGEVIRWLGARGERRTLWLSPAF